LSLSEHGQQCLGGQGAQDALPTGTCRGGSPSPCTSRSTRTIFLHTEGVALPLHLDDVRAQGWLCSQWEGQVHDALPRAHVPPLCDAVPAGILHTGTRGVSTPGTPALSDKTAHGCVTLLLSQPRCLPKPTPPGSLPPSLRLTFRNTTGSCKAKRRWLDEKFKAVLGVSLGWGLWSRGWSRVRVVCRML